MTLLAQALYALFVVAMAACALAPLLIQDE